ncbi:MAG: hypothetical protein JWN46_3375 [Acidimicrobiales bacterium]|nr:hypothetical protein [Acidimicrobiales bacterium]
MDLTVAAVPVYFGSMGAEYAWTKRRAAQQGPSRSDYERRDTIASLAMGTASLVAPLIMPKLLGPVTPGKGRYGKALVATALGAAVVTTAADLLARANEGPLPPAGVLAPRDLAAATAVSPVDHDVPGRASRRRAARIARRVASSAGLTAVAAGGVAVTTAWASRTSLSRMWGRRRRDLGTGPLTVAGAVLAWDFIYYWNHRLMHESRFLWAIHVVHHSSEHYNLSTALRQPVADAFGVFLPISLLALAGVCPEVIETARGVNLLYQFWIHTDAIGKLGPIEEVFNTASHHRVHHGSNKQYLDRNHGSILIIWDRLFGTFEREAEPVVYGLTKNIDSYNPARIATHEHADMLRDVRGATSWRDRLGFVVRGPGWAYARHAERAEPQPAAGVA